MSNLFTACASHILVSILVRVLLVVVILIVIFVVLGLVSAVLATGRFLTDLTTAPMYLLIGTVIAQMGPTAPLEIVLFVVFAGTIFARFNACVQFASPRDKLLNARPRFFFIGLELAAGFFESHDLVHVVIVFLVKLRKLFLKLDLAILARGFVQRVLPLQYLLVLVQLGRVCSETITLLHQSNVLLSLFRQLPTLLIGLRRQHLNLLLQLVAPLLICGDIFDGSVENDKLLLQVLNAMVRNPLLHLQIVELVGERFIPGLLATQLITEALAHLLAHQRCIDKLLRLDQLLVKLQLKAHVNFYLALELRTERIDLFLHIELLGVELDKFLFVGVSLEGCFL